MRRKINKSGFTLIELLVTVGIIAVLLAILLPGLSRARLRAKVVIAHSDLKQITTAICMYKDDNLEKIPIPRGSCNLRSAYELPVELMPYLRKGKEELDENFSIDQVDMKDPFTGDIYKYRAPGPIILNETILIPDGCNLWVQDNFPYGDCNSGRYYNDPKSSPVRYAVWTFGPDPEADIFDIPGRAPVPHKYWLMGDRTVGVVTHIEDSENQMHISP